MAASTDTRLDKENSKSRHSDALVAEQWWNRTHELGDEPGVPNTEPGGCFTGTPDDVPWWDEADGSEPENEIARASKPSAVEGEYDMGSAACLVPPQAAAENTATADWHGWQLRVGPPFMMNCAKSSSRNHAGHAGLEQFSRTQPSIKVWKRIAVVTVCSASWSTIDRGAGVQLRRWADGAAAVCRLGALVDDVSGRSTPDGLTVCRDFLLQMTDKELEVALKTMLEKVPAACWSPPRLQEMKTLAGRSDLHFAFAVLQAALQNRTTEIEGLLQQQKFCPVEDGHAAPVKPADLMAVLQTWNNMCQMKASQRLQSGLEVRG
ncbi:unnamed protein product [Symbiodinium microadriaticum]|nr:unnamed protein product [Symbiodinium microadriaticum]CAE7947200.1 unnamed protein product [Symbiodinium sp. KB8]